MQSPSNIISSRITPEERPKWHFIIDAVYKADPTRQGVLMVMMEHFTEKLSKFLPDGKIAIGIKYTKDSMEIVEHLSEIGFILFHTRKDSDQHLYNVNKVEILPEEELPANMYKNINTAKMYAKVEFEKIELDSSSLHSSRKVYTPETRYDAQYATKDTITIIQH